MSLKRRLLKIAFWVSGIFFFILLTTGVISYIYKDKIIRFVTNEIGSHIQGTVTIEEIDIAFFSSFPNISIQLHNVVALSTPGFNAADFIGIETDTALTAKRVSLAFNPFDFLRERFVVQEIKIQHADLSFFSDIRGNHNWNFVKASHDTLASQAFVDLQRIVLKQTNCRYYDAKQDIAQLCYFSDARLSGNVTVDGFRMKVQASMQQKLLQIASVSYFQNTGLVLGLDIEKKTDSLIFHATNISQSGWNIMSQGWYLFSSNTINLELKSKISDVSKFADVISEDLGALVSQYNISAHLDVDATISGKIDARNNPSLQARYSLQKGRINIDKERINIASKGVISSNNISSLRHYSLFKAALEVTHRSNTFEGVMSVLNFQKPQLEIEGDLSAELQSLSHIIDFDEYSLRGSVQGNVYLKGSVSALSSFDASFFSNTQTKFTGKLENVYVSAPSHSPYNFDGLSGTLELVNRDVSIQHLEGKLQKNPFTLSGTMKNFIPSLLFQDQHAHYNLALHISSFFADPFIAHYESLPESESNNEHSGLVQVTTHVFRYNTYSFEDVSVSIHFSNSKYQFRNAHFSTMGGSCSGWLSIEYLQNNTIVCVGNMRLQNLSTVQLFDAFDNFDQSFVTKDNISGTITSGLTFRLVFDKNWNLLYPHMNITADVEILNGAIRNFEPFIEIGKKIKVEEFQNVTFSEIKNTIRIQNDTLYIPKMDITSNAFEMVLSGTHALSNNFAYFMVVNMKSTFSNRFRRNNRMEDFGEIEQSPDGDIRLPLRLVGNPESFSIEYDFRTQMQQVRESFQRQRDDWREILNRPAPDEQQEPGRERRRNRRDDDIQTEFEIQFE